MYFVLTSSVEIKEIPSEENPLSIRFQEFENNRFCFHLIGLLSKL